AGLGFAAMLSWARRGVDPDAIDGRRQALEASLEAGADAALSSLERFALEVAAPGDADEALRALEAVERSTSAGGPARPGNDVALAAAVARLAWTPGLVDRGAVDRALDLLEATGEGASAVARAERFRLVRHVDGEL